MAGAMLLLAVVLWGLAQFLAAFFSISWLGWVGYGAAGLLVVFGIVTSSKSTTGECSFCGGEVGSTADVLEYLENDGMVVECSHCRQWLFNDNKTLRALPLFATKQIEKFSAPVFKDGVWCRGDGSGRLE